MQIAEILSDLTSLRVCDSSAALALVSARPADSSTSASKPTSLAAKAEEDDVDLARAKNLVDLHYAVKVRHEEGVVDGDLQHARTRVRAAVNGLR